MKNKRLNAVLADCSIDEVQALVRHMSYAGQSFEIKSHIANWKRTGKFSELKRYAKYFAVGFRYFLTRNRYQAIVGWQQFYSLIFCFFCEIFHVKKQNVVVALNFTYKTKKGLAGALYRWFMGKCVTKKYMDFLHVLSDSYANLISQEFDYPRERIIVVPFGVNDRFEEFSKMDVPEGYAKDGYALSIGRSNRDYDFLIRAWEAIDFPLVIISDTYQGESKSEKIRILKNVGEEASWPWIANCGIMVIPIDDETICSGDTVLLTSMMAERKLLVTYPSALAETYLSNGENALLTPKSENMFRHSVERLLQEEGYESLGKRAREDFLERYSRESMGKNITAAILSNG